MTRLETTFCVIKSKDVTYSDLLIDSLGVLLYNKAIQVEKSGILRSGFDLSRQVPDISTFSIRSLSDLYHSAPNFVKMKI